MYATQRPEQLSEMQLATAKRGKRKTHLAAQIAAKAEADAKAEEEEVELGIDGRPKHKYYNEELELRTKEIQDQFNQIAEELEQARLNIDRDAFYEAMEDLNYGGIQKFEVSPTRRLVKHHTHTVEQKEKFKEEH